MTTNVLLLNSIIAETQALCSAAATASGTTTIPCGYTWIDCPTDTTTWSSIPRLTGGTTLCVFDTASGYYRCGVCCLWTVPAGASVVQFEMWGAGSGSGTGNCCTSAPFGSTGAYSIAIIQAVTGCQYTLCAGCAYCCCSYCGVENSTGGCQSYVTGYGLSGVCASGAGCSYVFCNIRDYTPRLDTTCCVWATTSSGEPCICCNGTYMCHANGAGTRGEIPIHASRATWSGTVTCGFITGLPSLHGGGCLSTDSYGYMLNPPTVNPANGSAIGCCCFTFTSGSCCGGWCCAACLGNRQLPGQGGFATHMMGGNLYHYGDQGRAGMVKVTYC